MTNIEAVKNHALENYDTEGWDSIVECYTDKEIQEVLDLNNVIEGDHEKALYVFDKVQKIFSERREEVQSTAW